MHSSAPHTQIPRAVAVLVALLALLVVARPAAAAEPIGPLASAVRATQQGTDGDAGVDATEPSIAFDTQREQALVVYEQSNAQGDTSVFGRLLDAAGRPLGNAFTIAGVPGPGLGARDPAVTYDTKRHRYVVAYIGHKAAGDEQLLVRIVEANGTLGTTLRERGANDPVHGEPAIAYDATHDEVVVTYAEADGPLNSHLFADAFTADDGLTLRPGSVISTTADGSIFDSALVARPGLAQPMVAAWAQPDPGSGFKTQVFVRPFVITDTGITLGTQKVISSLPAGGAIGATIARNPDNNQIAVAFGGLAGGSDGTEVFVQRLDANLDELGGDTQVSSAGPAGSGFAFIAVRPAIAFDPVQQRYLVAWAGTDKNRPGGISDSKVEVMGRVIDAAGAPVGADDQVLSNHGVPSDTQANVLVGVPSVALAVDPATHRWLTTWAGDGVAPTVHGEQELYDRLVGELPPPAPAPVAPPAAPATPAVGGPAPARPAAAAAAPLDVTLAGIDWNSSTTAGRTTFLVMRVTRVRPGMVVRIRCTGPGCPKALHRRRAIRVTARRDVNLARRFFRRAKLRAGARIVIEVLDGPRIGRVTQLTVRRAAVPRERKLCLAPGGGKTRACPRV